MDLIRSDILTGSMVFPTTENLVDFDIAECGRSSRAEGFQKEFDCRLLLFGFSRVMENHDGQFPDLTLRAPHNNYSMKDCKLLIIRVCHQKHGVLKMCVKDTALSGLQWLGSLKPQFSFKS